MTPYNVSGVLLAASLTAPVFFKANPKEYSPEAELSPPSVMREMPSGAHAGFNKANHEVLRSALLVRDRVQYLTHFCEGGGNFAVAWLGPTRRPNLAFRSKEPPQAPAARLKPDTVKQPWPRIADYWTASTDASSVVANRACGLHRINANTAVSGHSDQGPVRQTDWDVAFRNTEVDR